MVSGRGASQAEGDPLLLSCFALMNTMLQLKPFVLLICAACRAYLPFLIQHRHLA